MSREERLSCRDIVVYAHAMNGGDARSGTNGSWFGHVVEVPIRSFPNNRYIDWSEQKGSN